MISLVSRYEMIGIFAKPVAELLERHKMLRALTIDTDISLPEYGLVKLKERSLSPAAATIAGLFSASRIGDLPLT